MNPPVAAAPSSGLDDFRAKRSTPIVVAACFLLIEPAIRIALWWPLAEWGGPRLLSNDAIWLVCGAMIAGLGLIPKIRNSVAGHPVLAALAGVWAIAAVWSSVQSVDPASALGRTLSWGMLLLFGLFALNSLRTRSRDAHVLILAVSFGFVGCASTLALSLFAITPDASFNWSTMLPGFYNVRHFGFEAMLAALAGGLYRPQGGKQALTWALRISAVIGWGMLFWSGGRGSFLAALAAIIFVGVIARRGQITARFLELGLLAALGLALALALSQTPRQDALGGSSFGALRAIGASREGAEAANADYSTGRLEIWREAIDVIRSHPVVGIGDGQMSKVLVSAQGFYTQPHNVLLQALLAWGFLGGMPFFVALGYGLLRAVQRVWRNAELGSPAMVGMTIALALSANALIDGTLYHSRQVASFLLALALALAASRSEWPDDTQSAP